MTQTRTSPASSGVARLEDGYAYFQGQIVPMHEAKVSIATHALQYGTGCFEGIRAYWNADQEQLYVLRMREHYERLLDSCKTLRIQLDESVEELCQITIELLRKQGHRQNVYIRPFAYKGSTSIQLRLANMEDSLAIYTFPMGNYVDISAGLRVCTSAWRRANSNAIPVRAKVTGGYINSALAVEDAKAAGFDEAILLTHDGMVSEGSSCNVFLLRNGKLITPAVTEDILEGITRNSLIEMVEQEFGMAVEQRRVDRTELYAAQEVFFCGTGVQISPIVSIDQREIGTGKPGEFSMRLQKLYLAACNGEVERYRHWLTPVYEASAEAR